MRWNLELVSSICSAQADNPPTSPPRKGKGRRKPREPRDGAGRERLESQESKAGISALAFRSCLEKGVGVCQPFK